MTVPEQNRKQPQINSSFTTRQVSKLLELSSRRIQQFVRAGVLSPSRDARNRYRFSFQDIILLRTAKGLSMAGIPPRRIRACLKELLKQLPVGKPLTAVQIWADGQQIVAREGSYTWQPESGQILLNFEVAGLVREIAHLNRLGGRQE